MDQGQIRFLDLHDERLMLAIPWIGMVAAFIYWFGGKMHLWVGHTDLALVMTSIIFLDGLHVTYTFILMWGLKELRQWTKDGGVALMGRFVAVAVALAVVFYFLRFSPLTHNLPMIIVMFYFFEAMGPAQHTMAQMRGISFCYHSAIRKTDGLDKNESKDALLIEQREKKYFRFLLAGDVFASIPYVLSNTKITFPGMYAVHKIGLVFMIFSALGLLLNAKLYPKQKRTKKMAYLSRVLLFPIRTLIPPAGLVVRACHGTEYLVILRQMTKNSESYTLSGKKVFVATALVSVLYAVAFVMTFPKMLSAEFNLHETHKIFFYLLMFHLVVRYLHYYMDAVLYRMSDARTRTVVGPLLVKTPAKALPVTQPNAVAA